MKKLLLIALMCLSSICLVHAQVNVRLEPVKKFYISGEPLSVKVTLVNNSGANVTLTSKDMDSWLNINIESSNGQEQIPQSRFATFPKVMIPAGKQISKKIDLRHFYDLTNEGIYRVYAVVKLPNGTLTGSAKKGFFISGGSTVWSQTVNIPNSPKKCKFVVLTQPERGVQKMYIQVRDGDTNIPYNAACVGNWLKLDRPRIQIDGKCNIHLLFLTTPQLCCYVRMDYRGMVTKVSYYKRLVAQPNLVFLPDGSIQVTGGALFDPTKPVQKVPDATTLPNM